MRAIAIALAFAVVGACGSSGQPERPRQARGLIVLGIDGMDPNLLRKLIDAGELPNLAALEQRGSFRSLPTTMPPQSPVAWSTFVTGLGAAGHGIYDFVHRDPSSLQPYLSTSRVSGGDDSLSVGSLSLSLSSAESELLRHGKTFWQILEERGIRATVVKVPANFPPPDASGSEALSGMGTPDLLGTYGTYQFFTDDAAMAKRPLPGGVLHRVDFGASQRATSSLRGPPDPLDAAHDPLTLPVRIVRDRRRPVALIDVGRESVMLQPGEWSEWIPVDFDPGVMAATIRGMVRMHLVSLSPLRLYVSPINIDPHHPAVRIAQPESYASALAKDVGRYYTQGMAEDTKALSAGVLPPRAFLQQWGIVLAERKAMLDRELERFSGGVLFVYFSSIDQLSHVFWRSLDPNAPEVDRRWADVIPEAYRRIDQVVGKVMKRLGRGTELVVMSDHGFAPYRVKVHLNTWLAERGYLAVLPPDKRKPIPLGHIDWSRTQAYALGLNQVFVNLRGREAHGIVDPSERQMVVERLARDLEHFMDPERSTRVVTEVARPSPQGPVNRRPDLLVGYNRGYRSSDESALGQVGDRVLEANRDQWSGDHCMDPRHVPGVLLTSFRPAHRPDGLADLAPTILDYFALPVPERMHGDSLWPKTRTAQR